MKAIMLSIQPYYVFLIIARIMGWNITQSKTVEVRKDFPKDPAWNKVVHIYCSKSKKSFNRIPKEYQPLMAKLLGKVIGEFVCDEIVDFFVFENKAVQYWNYHDLANSCLTYEEIGNYIGANKKGYGWHISDLKIYDTPKELGEFFTKGECQREFCADCKNFHRGEGWLDGSYCDEDCCIEFGIKPLTRPPQSWCYVEDLQ